MTCFYLSRFYLKSAKPQETFRMCKKKKKKKELCREVRQHHLLEFQLCHDSGSQSVKLLNKNIGEASVQKRYFN